MTSTPRHPRPRTLWSTAALAALTAAAGLALDAGSREERTPPDLQVEWLAPAETGTEEPLRGNAGERLHLTTAIRNVGGEDAFAVLVEAYTAIGRYGPVRRLQPGPDAGASLAQPLDLTLAEGMRSLCVSARLQRADAGDPDDPNRANNQLCRRIEIEPDGESEEGDSG